MYGQPAKNLLVVAPTLAPSKGFWIKTLHLKSVTVGIRLRFCHQGHNVLSDDNDNPQARRSCTKIYHVAPGIAHSTFSGVSFHEARDNSRQGEIAGTTYQYDFALDFTQCFSLSVSEIIPEVPGQGTRNRRGCMGIELLGDIS